MKNRHTVERTGLTVSVNNDFNRAFRIFNKKVQESGKLREAKERMYNDPPSVIKQKKRKMARKRLLKKLETERQERLSPRH